MSEQHATKQRVLMGVGGALVLVALVLAAIPMHASGPLGTVACGSLFSPANPYTPGFSLGDMGACDATMGTVKTLVWIIGILGAASAALGAAWLAEGRDKVPERVDA